VRLLLNFDILWYLIIVLAQMRCIRISFLYNLIRIIIKYFTSLLFGRQLLLRLSNIAHIISTVFIFKIFSLLYGELVKELLLILKLSILVDANCSIRGSSGYHLQ
jgi:hypothetical protein